MSTLEIITLVFTFSLSFISFYIGNMQRKEKGFLFNNAYIYASKRERDEMNTKPYYKQSSIVFTMLGSMFLFIFMGLIYQNQLLFRIVILHVIVIVVFAIVSSIIINRSENN